MSDRAGEDHPAGPGSLLLAGRYELQDLLGRGGMADVWRAHDRTLHRPVAVKLLRDTAGDDDDRRRFIAEARTLAGLSHSGLVTVLDAGFGSAAAGSDPAPGHDQPFLVMELVDGPTLAGRIGEGLGLEDVAAIGVQVADALAYVHRHGVVHRDVKPGNVLLGPQGHVRLADFGIARLLSEAARHTRTGQALGSAAYLAPEQVSGGEVTGAADVYSLGLVLLEAITGRREYAGSPTEAALARLSRGPAVPDALPEQWVHLLRAMTAVAPEDRPGAADVAHTLREQSTGFVPVPAEGAPDPTQVLRGEPVPPPASSGGFRLDGLLGSPSTALSSGWQRARRSSVEARAAAAVVAALVLFLLVVGLVDDDAAPSELPAGVPSELAEPLEDLHDAVGGTG